MKGHDRVIVISLFSAFSISLAPKAFSQADSLNSAVADTGKSRHTLYSAAGYGSNMIYLGSTISEDQSYDFAALSYGYRSSLFLSVSAFHLANHDPYAAFYAGSLSFIHIFNSWLDISLSTSRYHVAPSLRETLFSNFFYSDLTVGIDWKLLYSKLSAGWLYTSESNMYYQFRNSRFITTPLFFKKKAYISFDPYVNVLLGTLSTIDTNTDTIKTVTYPFYSTGTGSGSGPGNGNGSGSGSGSTAGTTTAQAVTSSTLSTRFGILEIDLGIPVSFVTNRFTFEVEPGYVLPFYDETYFPGTKGFLFTVSCYIKIF